MSTARKTGFAILSHHNLGRTAQLATALTAQGCKVAVHVDAKCPVSEFERFAAEMAGNRRVILCQRRHCEWGTFSLTEAVLDAAAALLHEWPELSHICHLSGDSLPVRPLTQFFDFLSSREGTDLIESVSAVEDVWVTGGLGIERFRFWFPFAWRKRRWLFDRAVDLQRQLGVARRLPGDLEPHLGSQWWCLTAATMRKITADPQRPRLDRYFRWCWIPDESYFQTLVRKHAGKILSQTFMLSQFDDSGQPHVFYDDHLPLLAGAEAYFARKIWHGADRLYDTFLNPDLASASPQPGLLAEAVASASRQRRFGRRGLVNAGRFPSAQTQAAEPARPPYLAIAGFDHAIAGFRPWLEATGGGTVHGRLFAPDRAHFASGHEIVSGCISAEPKIRDSDPAQFLRNVLWGSQGERQAFLFDAADNPPLADCLARDAEAFLCILKGAWAAELYLQGRPAAAVKPMALRAFAAERRLLNCLAQRSARARANVWDIRDFLADPQGVLNQLLACVEPERQSTLFTMPQVRNLAGLEDFIAELSSLGVPVGAPLAAATTATGDVQPGQASSRVG